MVMKLNHLLNINPVVCYVAHVRKWTDVLVTKGMATKKKREVSKIRFSGWGELEQVKKASCFVGE